MTLYDAARRHAVRMGLAVVGAFAFVILIDIAVGHSALAFAMAIGVLIWLNLPMLRFNCPRCGYNIFFRGLILLPWPRRSCAKCGLALDAT